MEYIQKNIDVRVEKVDTTKKMLFGFGIVSTLKGEPYIDLQNEYIPENVVLDASTEFMESDSRPALAMHEGEPIGKVIHGFPLLGDIAKSMGIKTERTGFIVGVKIENDEVLKKYRNGEYTGFSLGGRARRVPNEEVGL